MKKGEQVLREILYQCMEQKNRRLTQRELSIGLHTALSNVHHAIQPLVKMGAIAVQGRNFTIISPRKILLYWASVRSIQKDIIYATRVDEGASAMEKRMPADVVFTACSGYKLKFKEMPADYSEVYIYADNGEEIKRRFGESRNPPNLFVLQKDRNMERYGKTATWANLFVDLWNMKEWYAADFLKALEAKLHGILE
ncbi:MAG TPA: winged helix-turn-helix domain-containing protein [Candidatus Nanoarchaeia archaeon]|nr:winged helix-turn-helix domain-containing protein [Candidatus Nanoarchaeia archaeon]